MHYLVTCFVGFIFVISTYGKIDKIPIKKGNIWKYYVEEKVYTTGILSYADKGIACIRLDSIHVNCEDSMLFEMTHIDSGGRYAANATNPTREFIERYKVVYKLKNSILTYHILPPYNERAKVKKGLPYLFTQFYVGKFYKGVESKVIFNKDSLILTKGSIKYDDKTWYLSTFGILCHYNYEWGGMVDHEHISLLREFNGEPIDTADISIIKGSISIVQKMTGGKNNSGMLPFTHMNNTISFIKGVSDIEIFTSIGKKLVSIQNMSSMNTYTLAKGIYFIRIEDCGKNQFFTIIIP